MGDGLRGAVEGKEAFVEDDKRRLTLGAALFGDLHFLLVTVRSLSSTIPGGMLRRAARMSDSVGEKGTREGRKKKRSQR